MSIFFAGKSSDDFNVIVERYPDYVVPRRKQETEAVPGRNGDLLFSQDAYENYMQEYEVYISAERPRLPAATERVLQWLHGQRGYQRLQDSYTPDLYRMAWYTGGTSIRNILNRFGRFTLQFNCKPQRFYVSGEQQITIAESGTELINPSLFDALPLITVHGSGAGTLEVGGTTVRIDTITDGMILDSDTQNAYVAGQNLNAAISAPVFPILGAGATAFTWNGGITGIEIIPRWWTL